LNECREKGDDEEEQQNALIEDMNTTNQRWRKETKNEKARRHKELSEYKVLPL